MIPTAKKNKGDPENEAPQQPGLQFQQIFPMDFVPEMPQISAFQGPHPLPMVFPAPPPSNYQESAELDLSNMKKEKGKRRSKNDQEGRNYKCPHCIRTYLSYPALYTHIKTKHSLPGEAPSLTNGRGRGRPKKNVVHQDKPDPSSPLYFRTEDKKGGPTAVIYGFSTIYKLVFKEVDKYGGYQNHPLYIQLYKLHASNIKTYRYDSEHLGLKEFGLPPNGIKAAIIIPEEIKEIKIPEDKIEKNEEHKKNHKNSEDDNESKEDDNEDDNDNDNEEDANDLDALPDIGQDELLRKTQRKCDEIFAEYLDYVAKKINKGYYTQILKFIFLLRESVNRFSEKLKKLQESDMPMGVPAVQPPIEKNPGEYEEYCLVYNAEHVPDISNEFVTQYLEELKPGIERQDAIELTQNVCHWLFVNGYTCSKLSLIQENP